MPTATLGHPMCPTSLVAASLNRRRRPTTGSPILTILLVLALSSFACLSGAEDSLIEFQHLLDFRNFLATHNNVSHLEKWNTSKPPCSGHRANWASVVCFRDHVFGLQLENMGLKGPIDVDSLIPLRHFRTLSLKGNNFEGAMPDWRKLGALKSLYVSHNKFSGQISEDAFKGMNSLKKVDLSSNEFSGHIPSSLEKPKLIVLKLENNQFTGKIPFVSSDNLKLLNVSNNQLEGQIPEPLAKMDPSSFAGNKALCGKPLDVECLTVQSKPKTAEPQKTGAWKIAAIAIAAILVVVILALIFIFVQKRRRSQTTQGRKRSIPADEESVSNVAEVGVVAPVKPRKRETSGSTGKLSFVSENRERFELQDLMRASAEVLGSGNFGASYKAALVDGEALVVKRFKQMNTVAREDFFEHMRRLGRLKHPNLLPLVAYLYRKEEKLLVFDYAENGSLATMLHGTSTGFTWEIRLKIVKGVGKGLVYLQRELPSLTLPHGHLKASNVLLDKDFNPLLMDYALAPVVNSTNVHQVLLAYRSPEYVKHNLVSKKTDVWCLGLLIMEILSGKYVAHGSDQVDLIGYVDAAIAAKAFDKNMEGSEEEMERLFEIAVGCCQEDPEKRLDLEEAVRLIEQVDRQES